MRTKLHIPLLCCALLAAPGCQQDPYRLIRGGASTGDAGLVLDMGPDTAPPCIKSNMGIEICDGKDNNCNGQVDENFNFQVDSNNCGQCGKSCLLPGAITVCELAQCKFTGCAPTHYDLNNDLAKGWDASSDGCEYGCAPTGNELCDGLDNDCNGKIDETFTLATDVQNCGKCGNACQIANAIPKCENSVCKIQSCKTNYLDKDKQEANGCEAYCAPTGAEVCDGVDNDCNGVVDDPGGKVIDFMTNTLHCGGCNNVCDLPNSTSSCVQGKCVFSGCISGWVDANKNAADGCECQYKGTEQCDGLDNDCDGLVDFLAGGLAMSKACYSGASGTLGKGPCVAGTQTCSSGYWSTCMGEVVPKVEHCDGNDTDCDGNADPMSCVWTAAGREKRLDEPATSQLGANNSTQLTLAGSGTYLLASWVDLRNGDSSIYGNLSSDGGKTWLSTDVAMATESATTNKLAPRVAFGGTGGSVPRAYLAYQRFTPSNPSTGTPGVRNAMVRVSGNGGLTWGNPVGIQTSTSDDTLYLNLAVLPGLSDKVVACWEQINVTGAIKSNIYCSLSINNGATFSAAILVNSTPDKAIVPRIALDSQYLYVVWQEGTDIKLDSSPIQGNALSFAADTTLSNGSGQHPVIWADGTGRVVVAWEDLRDTLVNIRVNASANHGLSWLSSDTRVDLDVVDGESTSPVIDGRPGGRIFVAWADSCRGKHDVYVNYSDTSGATWASQAVMVPSKTAGSSSSLQPNIAVDPAPGSKNLYAVWLDGRTGPNHDIYFGFSMDDGKTWNIPDFRLNESPAGKAGVGKPLLWASAARVAVLWTDFRVAQGTSIGSGSKGDIYATYVEH